MPPRKSDVSKVATGDEVTPAKEPLGVNIEDYSMPKAIVTRLAKGVLPPNTQIQGNAMLAMSKSATVFVNYLASQANEHAATSNRKTVTPQDVLNALDDLEFSEFKPKLEAELARYNEIQTDKRNASKNKQAAGKNGSAGDAEKDGDRDSEPAAKKAKLDPDESMGIDPGDLPENEHPGGDDDDVGEDDGREDEPEDDDDDEADQDERLEVDEQLDDPEEKEGAGDDEALDNGEDSE